MGLWDSLFSSKNVTPAPTQKAPRMGLLRTWNICEIAPSDYVVLDLETAGLDACTCDILEIGLIRYRNHIEVDRYHSMVQPEGRIEPQAAAVNGITWAKVCRAPLFSELKDRVFSFIGEDTVVGFNVDFDVKFLQTRAGQKLDNSMFDVLALARGVMPNRASYKLDALRGELGLGGKAHTAIGDCVATQKLYRQCIGSDIYKKDEAEKIAKEEAIQNKIKQHKEALQRLKEKQDQFKANLPRIGELKAISANMIGSVDEYLDVIDEILANNKQSPVAKVGETRLEWYREFFIIKQDASLRYVALNIAPELVDCPFIIGPTTTGEFMDGTRFYVSSPAQFKELSEYILIARRTPYVLYAMWK